MKIKDIWRWVLSRESNHDLSELCVGIGATIQGFRNNRVTNQNRQIVIQNLLTPKSISRLCQSVSLDEEGEEMATKSISELKNKLQEYHPEKILKVLLLKGEEEKAFQLFSFIEEEMEKEESIEIEEDIEEYGNDAGKVKKLEKKIQKLKKHNESEIERLRDKVQSLQGENQKLQKMYQQYQHEKNELQSIIQKLEESNHQLEQQRMVYQKKIIDYKEQYNRLQAKLVFLETKEGEELFIPGKKRRIALVGNPKNEIVRENQALDIQIIEGIDEIEDIDTFDEVWVLTYKIPMMRQKKIVMSLKRNDVVKISTFAQLVEKIAE